MKKSLAIAGIAVASLLCLQGAFAAEQKPAPAAKPAAAPAKAEAPPPAPPKPVANTVGAVVPAWSAALVGEGKSIASTDLKGKAYALVFVNASCSACRSELSELRTREFGDNLKMFIVSMDFNAERSVGVYRDTYKVPFPILDDSKQVIADIFDFASTPSSVIVGKDGKVANRWVGFSASKRDAVIDAFDKYAK